MPRFWGFHHIAFHASELQFWQGKSNVYRAVPFDERMRAGDYVFLFWGDDHLNGWGIIQKLGERKTDNTRDVTVFISLLRSQLASVKEEIKGQKVFENYDRLKDGPMSSYNDDQVRYLNRLCSRAGSPPPDPDDVREQPANAPKLRPLDVDFIKGEKLKIEEGSYDEFKEIKTQQNVKESILKEIDEYVIAFLNMENREDEEFCRILWGVEADVWTHLMWRVE